MNLYTKLVLRALDVQSFLHTDIPNWAIVSHTGREIAFSSWQGKLRSFWIGQSNPSDKMITGFVVYMYSISRINKRWKYHETRITINILIMIATLYYDASKLYYAHWNKLICFEFLYVSLNRTLWLLLRVILINVQSIIETMLIKLMHFLLIYFINLTESSRIE